MMITINKRAWLKKHGYIQHEFNGSLSGEYTVQWCVFNRAMLYTGRGTDESTAYNDLYDVVKGTLYNMCVINYDNGHL